MKTKTKIQTKKSTAVSVVSIEGHPVPTSSPSKVLGGLLSFKGDIVKTRKYYTLVGLNTDHVWEIIFGDYDREVVEDERADSDSLDFIKKFKIIATSDAQADINEKVAQLNGEKVIHGLDGIASLRDVSTALTSR